MINIVEIFKQQLSREYLLNCRQPRLIINSSLFFLMVLVFFPLTMTSDINLMRTVAPGLVWIAVLFAMFLSADRLFKQDYDDGIIEQWLASGLPISIMVFTKILVHWLVNLLPILIFCPIIALLFSLSLNETFILILSLLCGTPAIIFLCGLAAAFSVDLQQNGVLIPLILLPLTIPIMIFGSGALIVTMQGLEAFGYIALLLAISLLSIVSLPFAIAGVFKT